MISENTLKKKLNSILFKYYENQGFDKDDIENLGLYSITINNNSLDKCLHIAIYAEASNQEFFEDLADKLDSIIQKYDPESYFDIETTGVFTAKVNYDTKTKENYNIKIEPQILYNFGEDIVDSLNSYYHFSDYELDDCKIIDGNKLYVSVFRDGRGPHKIQIKLDPRFENDLNIYYDDVLDKFKRKFNV